MYYLGHIKYPSLLRLVHMKILIIRICFLCPESLFAIGTAPPPRRAERQVVGALLVWAQLTIGCTQEFMHTLNACLYVLLCRLQMIGTGPHREFTIGVHGIVAPPWQNGLSPQAAPRMRKMLACSL